MFQVGPARLTLAPGSQVFQWVLNCSRCERVMESQVTVQRRSDLREMEVAVFCAECARLPVGSASGGVPEATNPSGPQTVAIQTQTEAARSQVTAEDELARARRVAEHELSEVTALVAEAERRVADLRAEAAQVQEAADRWRSEAAALLSEAALDASELRSAASRTLDAAHADRDQATAALAEAEKAASEICSRAEAEMAQTLSAARRELLDITAEAGDREGQLRELRAEAGRVSQEIDRQRSEAAALVAQEEQHGSERGKTESLILEAGRADRDQAAAALADAEARAASLVADAEQRASELLAQAAMRALGVSADAEARAVQARKAAAAMWNAAEAELEAAIALHAEQERYGADGDRMTG